MTTRLITTKQVSACSLRFGNSGRSGNSGRLGSASVRAAALALTLWLFAAPDIWAQAGLPAPPTIDQGSEPEPDLGKDGSTEINVKNADLAAIVRIFSKKTRRNYILDENLKGKVSIYLPGKVSSDEAIRILDSVLALKGFTSVPIGENLWKIVPAREARQTTIPTKLRGADGTAATSAMVTRLVNLKYVGAEDIQKLVSQLISPNGLINAYTGTNALIIIDSEDNIERVVNIIGSLDVPSSDREMTIVPVKFADAKDIADKLKEILGDNRSGGGGGSADENDILRPNFQRVALAGPPGSMNNPVGAPPPGGGANVSTSTVSVSARAREPKIIADERTNSIIVVADEDTTARIRALVSQLDSEVDMSGSRFYVYRCQHADAEEIAQILGGLSNGSGQGGSRNNQPQLSPGLGGIDFGGGGFGGGGFGGSRSRNSRRSGSSFSGSNSFDSTSGLADNRRAPGEARSDRNTGGPAGAVSVGENISITADPATNSLIISASKTDYLKILELLKKLDIKRRQVLVEAILLEVAVEDTQTLRTGWLTSGGGADGGVVAQNNTGDLTTLFSDPTRLSQFSIAAASAGTLSLPGGIQVPTQTILITAASRNSNANVLSAPTILTTDNEEAQIVVGQNVPFVASRSSDQTNLSNTFNQVDRRDVGITLRLTPQISSGEFVTLKSFTEVSDVVAATVDSDLGPTTTIRTNETTVITKDGQMIVIGGLLADAVSEVNEGVPFLREVPVFGHLFKGNSQGRRRTNLLVFLTPHIVKDQFDAREQTKERAAQLDEQIQYEEINPSRQEVLRNKAIDRVAESYIFEGEKPGTILPPDDLGNDEIVLETAPALARGGRASNRDDFRVDDRNARAPTRAELPSDDGEVIELEIAPELPPGAGAAQLKGFLMNGDAPPAKGGKKVAATARARISGAERSVPAGDAARGSGTHIVLEADPRHRAALSALPFEMSNDTLRVGVIVPNEGAGRGELFKTGREIEYLTPKGPVKFTTVAAFPAADAAESVFEDVRGHWHTLSPYEIINFGQTPWRPEQAATSASRSKATERTPTNKNGSASKPSAR